MISARYAAATAFALALASVPTIIHSYLGTRVVDGLSTEGIPVVLEGMIGTATGRKSAWVREHFESEDWIERTYAGNRQEASLFVARSYDAKRLYHHPELALLRGMQTTPLGLARVAARPDVPLHIIRTSRANRGGVAVYVLLHDGQFVERPILFQLQAAVRSLFRGRMAMTLFFAADGSGNVSDIDRAPAAQVVLAALAAFESQPRTSSH